MAYAHANPAAALDPDALGYRSYSSKVVSGFLQPKKSSQNEGIIEVEDSLPHATDSPGSVSGATLLLDSPMDEALFQALRARRTALAKEQGVPPYVIFQDRTLIEMARQRPRHRHQMAVLTGVGEVKLERYGDDFLTVVAAHATD